MTIDDHDIDRVVSEYASRWKDARPQPPSLTDALQQMRQTRHVRHRAWAIAPTVVIVAAVAATTVNIAASHHGPSRTSPTSHPAVATSRFGPLTLRHPTGWRYVPAQSREYSRGPSDDLGYLTDQPIHPQCVTRSAATGITISCHRPVTRLTSGIFVIVREIYLPLAVPGNATIAGQPAQFSGPTAPVEGQCPNGATVTIEALITPRNTEFAYDVTACLAGANLGPSERAVRAMLDTATFVTPPTPTPTPSGPTVAQISPQLLPYRGTCVSTDLRARVTQSGSEASAPFLVIRLTNTSDSSCTMDGYVHLAAYDQISPNPLPLAIARGTYEVSDPGPSLITLKAHGGSAYFVVGTGTANGGGANGVRIVRLEFDLGPHQGTVSLALPTKHQLGATPNQNHRYPTGLTALSAHPPAGLEHNH